MTPNVPRRAFVVGAHLPNGGTHMAYQVGRILAEEFGYRAIAVAVRGEDGTHGIHDYALPMPGVSLADMERQIGPDDVLIANPSFSSHQFGWRLPGFKLCYVQGFNTYALLDRAFDHYVAVSPFVRDYLRCVYTLETNVIAPFVPLDRLPPAVPWRERPANLVLPYRKGIAEVWELAFARLRERIAARAPSIEFAAPLADAGLAQRELLARLGGVRCVLVLSAAEGFGLVPLEAMSMGTLVAGFDGFGGRAYQRSGENCITAAYPQIDRVADLLVGAFAEPTRAETLADAGRETAASYSYAAFRAAWTGELRLALGRAGRL